MTSEPSDGHSIAVLITCHNRRETTLRCLESLGPQALPEGWSLRIVLTDDGSSDGTGDAVREQFPEVTVVDGDGSLFWAGGTALAWETAGEADYYLWLNDDVVLEPDAIATLIATHGDAGRAAAIIVGATCDPDTRRTSTGGIRRESWYRGHVLDPSDEVQRCDAFNGNIVLIPRHAERRLGRLTAAFSHYFADADYGMRANAVGIPCLLAPGYLGQCRLNPLTDTSFDTSLSFRERWSRMVGKKGYRRPREWWAFVRAHAPRPKALYWSVPYLLFFLEGALGCRVRLRKPARHRADIA